MQSRIHRCVPDAVGPSKGLHSMHHSCNKVPYASQLDAELALAALRMKAHRRERRETGSYLCSACGRWHLTSKSPSQVPPWRKSRKT